MKTIGIIGGMSWESTALYYKHINQGVKEKCGGLHSAKIILSSVNFADIETCQSNEDWEGAGKILNQCCKSLERAGADVILIATNTMHKIANQIMNGVDLPLIHIVDPTAKALAANGHKCVGLIGTKFTMQEPFYKERMKKHHGIEVLVPNDSDQLSIHQIIYEELCLGNFSERSKNTFLEIVKNLHAEGASAIILGCTEIGLLLSQNQTKFPLFDTTLLHAESAVNFALKEVAH